MLDNIVCWQGSNATEQQLKCNQYIHQNSGLLVRFCFHCRCKSGTTHCNVRYAASIVGLAACRRHCPPHCQWRSGNQTGLDSGNRYLCKFAMVHYVCILRQGYDRLNEWGVHVYVCILRQDYDSQTQCYNKDRVNIMLGWLLKDALSTGCQ